jgi:thioredoxin family protein
VWPDPRVVKLVNERFLPARVHVKEQAEEFRSYGERFGASWTPTILVLDPAGIERHRIEGFLPADELLAQLHLGLGHLAFEAHGYDEAMRHFDEVLHRFPDSDAAPEAQYWEGVSKYKASGDPRALGATVRALEATYAGSVWAKKASVWK